MNQVRLTIATLLAAWTLGTAEMAVAQTTDKPSTVNVLKSGVKKVRLFSPVNTPVDVAVIDLTGNLLYQGTLRSLDKRGALLNLVNLPDGRYYVTATNDGFWMSQGLTIRNDVVSVDAQNMTELTKPVLTTYAQNKYELVTPGVKELTVSIYDRMNDLVFSKSFGQGNTHRFDLSSLPAGDYTFVYGPSQKQFTERVAIK
ncbi:T9SS C-terminal target domain-containing protein [Fibrella sp. WM1]|uniref:T9SS C-terminal target domain-containing protein n=1 Tax=Fibrella musci TaxID=3242485 RepID=UPI003521593A